MIELSDAIAVKYGFGVTTSEAASCSKDHITIHNYQQEDINNALDSSSLPSYIPMVVNLADWEYRQTLLDGCHLPTFDGIMQILLLEHNCEVADEILSKLFLVILCLMVHSPIMATPSASFNSSFDLFSSRQPCPHLFTAHRLGLNKIHNPATKVPVQPTPTRPSSKLPPP